MKAAGQHLYKPSVLKTCTKLYLWMPTLNFTSFHESQNIMIFFQPFEKKKKTEKLCLAHGPLKNTGCGPEPVDPGPCIEKAG